jgi:hypothetical protein
MLSLHFLSFFSLSIFPISSLPIFPFLLLHIFPSLFLFPLLLILFSLPLLSLLPIFFLPFFPTVYLSLSFSLISFSLHHLSFFSVSVLPPLFPFSFSLPPSPYSLLSSPPLSSPYLLPAIFPHSLSFSFVLFIPLSLHYHSFRSPYYLLFYPFLSFSSPFFLFPSLFFFLSFSFLFPSLFPSSFSLNSFFLPSLSTVYLSFSSHYSFSLHHLSFFRSPCYPLFFPLQFLHSSYSYSKKQVVVNCLQQRLFVDVGCCTEH